MEVPRFVRVAEPSLPEAGTCVVDSIGDQPSAPSKTLRTDETLTMYGWAFVKHTSSKASVRLTSTESPETAFEVKAARTFRQDVLSRTATSADRPGFVVSGNLADVPPGEYDVGVRQSDFGHFSLCRLKLRVKVLEAATGESARL